MSADQPTNRSWTSLIAVLIVQTQNAFNDNFVKFVLIGLAMAVAANSPVGENVEFILTALIPAPFILFAPVAGWFSDRFSKQKVIWWVRRCSGQSFHLYRFVGVVSPDRSRHFRIFSPRRAIHHFLSGKTRHPQRNCRHRKTELRQWHDVHADDGRDPRRNDRLRCLVRFAPRANTMRNWACSPATPGKQPSFLSSGLASISLIALIVCRFIQTNSSPSRSEIQTLPSGFCTL